MLRTYWDDLLITLSRIGGRMFGGYEIALWGLLIVAAATDLLWGKVFNVTTLPFLAIGLLYRLFLVSPASAGEGLIAVLVAFFLFLPFWQMKAFAAGDVKLLMAVGAWTNTATTLKIGAFAIVVGALVGGFVLFRTKGLKESLESLTAHAKRKADGKGMRIPFAPAFLCAFAILKVAEMRQWTWL